MRKTPSLIARAWLEWVVGQQLETGDHYWVEKIVAMDDWFIPYELGFREGPSIVYIARHLESINRTNRALFASGKRPSPRARLTVEKTRRFWQEMLRHLAVARCRDRVERRRARTARLAA